MAAELTCPPFGAGSVDFATLHSALTSKKPKTQDEINQAAHDATALPAATPEPDPAPEPAPEADPAP